MKLPSKKVIIGIVVTLSLIILLAITTRPPAYQPPQHSQEYLDLREYHISSYRYKKDVIDNAAVLGLMLIDFLEKNKDIDEEWILEYFIETSLEESIMKSLEIKPPPDHIYELYFLYYLSVGELTSAIECLDKGWATTDGSYFYLAVKHITEAAKIFQEYEDILPIPPKVIQCTQLTLDQ